MSTQTINTIVISDEPKSTALMKKILVASDYKIIFESTQLQDLSNTLWDVEPDLIVVIMEKTGLEILGQLKIINQQYPLPIVIFTKDDRDDAIDHAIDIGVSAYIVNGLSEERILPIVRTANARFQQHQKMKNQLNELRTTLAERKIIDRAKGIIMEQRQCSEDDAYKLLRTTAMKQNLRLAVLAQNIIDAASLLTSN